MTVLDTPYSRPAPANPGPLGYFSLATTTLLVGLMVFGVRGLNSVQMLVGQAAGVGGLGMLISGFWHHHQGSTFGATAFGMYGLFYISFAVILYPESGVVLAYPDGSDYNNALGLYLLVWFLLSIIMWPACWRINVGLTVLFTFVWLYFLFLALGFMTGNKNLTNTGAAFGMCVGGWSYILGMEPLYAADDCVFQIPNPSLARKRN